MDPSSKRYLSGLLLSAAGMLVISPDGMLLKMAGDVAVFDALFVRGIGIGLVLTAWIGLRDGRPAVRALARPDRWMVGAAACMAAANLFFVTAMLHTTVANVLVILATIPFWAALLSRWLLRERVATRTWVAIAVALGGVAVIVSEHLGGGPLTETWVGDLAAVGAAMAHAAALVLARGGASDTSRPLALSGFLTAVVAGAFAPWTMNLEQFLLLVLLGFVILPLALGLFLSGTRRAPAPEIGLMAMVETVLGPLWAWIGVGEVPNGRAIGGGVLVAAAVVGNAVLGIRERHARDAPP